MQSSLSARVLCVSRHVSESGISAFATLHKQESLQRLNQRYGSKPAVHDANFPAGLLPTADLQGQARGHTNVDFDDFALWDEVNIRFLRRAC